MTSTRKPMIRTGLSLRFDEVWTESQFSEILQIITAKNIANTLMVQLLAAIAFRQSPAMETGDAEDGLEKED